MLPDLVTEYKPSAERQRFCTNGIEHHLPEGAIMLAFAMHLLRTIPGLQCVTIHPDGEHGKRLEFKRWLEGRSFQRREPWGRTAYGGTYLSAAGQTLKVIPKPGLGDVEAESGGVRYLAECKGGVINTRHPGLQSRLRRGLCEAVGALLASSIDKPTRQFAVVPRTQTTQQLALRMAPRVSKAGIAIALVDRNGNIEDVTAALREAGAEGGAGERRDAERHGCLALEAPHLTTTLL